MAKDLVLGLTLAQKFFSWILPLLNLEIVASYHCMQFQGKLINQTWENGKKPSFVPDFGLFWPPKIFFVGFTFTICQKLLQAIIACYLKENQWTKLEKMAKKPSFGPNFGPFGPTLVLKKIFRRFYLH